MSEEKPLYQLHNGSVILNEELSDIMYQIVDDDPMLDQANYPTNDIGISALFSKYFKHNTLYCPEMKSWYFYNGQKWVKDEGETVVNEEIKQFVELMTFYCLEKENVDNTIKASYTSFIARLGNRNVRDRLLKDARSSMTFSVNKFDANPYLLNCLNGTYDLKTGKFHKFKADDYLTYQTNCNCPVGTNTLKPFDRWDEFIGEIMCGDKELEEYLQKCLGYSLSGINREEKMFMFYGQTTRNGKSTLINTILHVLGDYGTTADIYMLCKTRFSERDPSRANPSLCNLKGKRFLALNESDENSRLDESLLKNYTGNDPINTRQLYGTNFTFTPQFTMFMSGNNLPDILDKSVFSSERVVVIPFNRHFNKDEQDKDLKEKFTTDEAKTYIFKWLLDGYNQYVKDGLNTAPQIVEQQVEQYEKDNDIVALFFDERVEKSEVAEDRVFRQYLYTLFKNYCLSNGIQYPMSSQKFYKNCERLGFAPIRKSGNWYITNVTIKKVDNKEE